MDASNLFECVHSVDIKELNMTWSVITGHFCPQSGTYLEKYKGDFRIKQYNSLLCYNIAPGLHAEHRHKSFKG